MPWSQLRKAKWFDNEDHAVDYIHELYNKAVTYICENFSLYEQTGTVSENHAEHSCYPYIGISISHDDLFVDPSFAYGVINEPGHYGTTVTAPALYDSYFREQIKLLLDRHGVSIVVGYSNSRIPLPFVIEHSHAQFDVDELMRLQSKFVLPDLKRIDDSYANATFSSNGYRPLALFTGERVDFSLQRLQHYTGTAPHHFQKFVLLTNYQRYIDEFINQVSTEVEHHKNENWELIGPGSTVLASHKQRTMEMPKSLPQMPAYHFKKDGNNGITIINIGVGPSNAKTITDHLAVLRPHCWIMLGHCAGLRARQT